MERRFDDFDTDFLKDYETRFKSKGLGYDRFRPAYQYGFEAHNRYAGRDWQSIEPELRTDWQKNYPNDSWNDFKDAIRTGFDRVKQGAQNMGRNLQQGAQNMGQNMQQGAQNMGQNMQQGLDRTTGSMSRNFDTYEKDFQSDFDRSYRSKGYDFQHVRPAYQYGYTLATEKRYQGRNWNDIEMDARREWLMQHPGEAWDDFKDAVRNAYQRVKSDVKDTLS